jgi:hypothetical protein
MENMTAAQAEALDQLRTAGLARYTWANELGVASFARGNFGALGSAPSSGVLAFLANFGQAFGPPDIREAARFVRVREDALGWRHFEYQQTYALPDANETPPGSAPPNAPAAGWTWRPRSSASIWMRADGWSRSSRASGATSSCFPRIRCPRPRCAST